MADTDNQAILQIIKNSSLFKEIKSINDLIEHARSKSRIIIGSHSVLAGAIGLAPVPLPDQPVLLALQATMVGGIAWAYGISKSKKQIKNLIFSSGPYCIGFAAKTVAKVLKATFALTAVGMIVDSCVGFGSFAIIGHFCMKIFDKELLEAGMLGQIKEMVGNYNDAIKYFEKIKDN